LAEVQSRGQLVCASNSAVPGFANLEADGTYTGFRRPSVFRCYNPVRRMSSSVIPPGP
jgi:hypothetical protein